MKSGIRKAIRDRADGRCEYCQLHEDDDVFAFHVEHIIAKQHGGSAEMDNLAWSCQECNTRKGPNLSGRLKATDDIVPLFHPRRQRWSRHFYWEGPYLVGKTKAGQATIRTLDLNAEHRIEVRKVLIELGEFPPVL